MEQAPGASGGISNKVGVKSSESVKVPAPWVVTQPVCHGYLSKQRRAVSLKSHVPTSTENAKIRRHCECSHRHRAILGGEPQSVPGRCPISSGWASPSLTGVGAWERLHGRGSFSIKEFFCEVMEKCSQEFLRSESYSSRWR